MPSNTQAKTKQKTLTSSHLLASIHLHFHSFTSSFHAIHSNDPLTYILQIRDHPWKIPVHTTKRKYFAMKEDNSKNNIDIFKWDIYFYPFNLFFLSSKIIVFGSKFILFFLQIYSVRQQIYFFVGKFNNFHKQNYSFFVSKIILCHQQY